MKKLNKSLIAGISLFVAFAVFTVLVKVVDVAAAGPLGSKVGFSKINTIIFDKIGTNDVWYKISEVFGMVALALVGVFACVGLVQLIKRKNLWRVDKHILALGAFYVIIGLIYLLFIFVEINYRPVLVDGVLESSYPSSHSVLSICVLSSSMIETRKLFGDRKKTIILLDTLSAIIMSIIFVGRILSGMHWPTDIIGGLLLSLALVFIFKGCLESIEQKTNNQKA